MVAARRARPRRPSTATTVDEVAAAIDRFGPPYVVKQDGLAAGKGVIVTSDRDAALAHAAEALPVVVEEYLDGPEVQPVRDHRRRHVAAAAARPGLQARRRRRRRPQHRRHGRVHAAAVGARRASSTPSWSRVVEPTVAEMARRGTPFTGLLYAGLALTSRGLRVVEFNCRFGDPETQAVLALLDSPLGQVLDAAATGRLARGGRAVLEAGRPPSSS